MKEIFTLKEYKYSTRRQNLQSKTPQTVTYGLESFSFKAAQIWNAIPKEIQTSNELTIKSHIKSRRNCICKCKLCKLYIPNLGLIENTK